MFRIRKSLGWCLCAATAMMLLGCEQKTSTQEILDGLSESDRRALTETMVNTPFVSEGISNPSFVSAEDCGLNDSSRVIGVVVQGQARAYPLSRMTGMTDHVVNDKVLDAEGKKFPFTVTYCDMTDCVRVFEPTTEITDDTLKVGTLGLLDKGLALTRNGKQFKQIDSIEGLKEYPHKRTTWGEWKAEYPDSLVYRGRGAKK